MHRATATGVCSSEDLSVSRNTLVFYFIYLYFYLCPGSVFGPFLSNLLTHNGELKIAVVFCFGRIHV